MLCPFLHAQQSQTIFVLGVYLERKTSSAGKLLGKKDRFSFTYLNESFEIVDNQRNCFEPSRAELCLILGWTSIRIKTSEQSELKRFKCDNSDT